MSHNPQYLQTSKANSSLGRKKKKNSQEAKGECITPGLSSEQYRNRVEEFTAVLCVDKPPYTMRVYFFKTLPESIFISHAKVTLHEKQVLQNDIHRLLPDSVDPGMSKRKKKGGEKHHLRIPQLHLTYKYLCHYQL